MTIYTGWQTLRFTSERERIVPLFLVSGKTRADIRFEAVSIVFLVFLAANGATSKIVGIHIVLVTVANVSIDAHYPLYTFAHKELAFQRNIDYNKIISY